MTSCWTWLQIGNVASHVRHVLARARVKRPPVVK